MTNFEALQASILFPVEDLLIKKSLFDRGLLPPEDYTFDNQRSVDLAIADMYCKLIAAPNVSEGGYSVSLSDKTSLMKAATAIYIKHGEADPFANSQVTSSSPW